MDLTTLIHILQTFLMAWAVLLLVGIRDGTGGSGPGIIPRSDAGEKSFLEGLQSIIDYCEETAGKGSDEL